MGKLRALVLVGSSILVTSLAHAQTTPVEDIEAAATTSSTVFTAFAGIAVTAFAFAMVIRYARKGAK